MYLSRCAIGWMKRGPLVGVLLFFFLSGFSPTSQYPVSGTPTGNIEAIFSGIWEGTLGERSVTVLFTQQSLVTIGATRIGGVVRAHPADRLSHNEQRLAHNEQWLEFEADVSAIRDEIFVSARLIQIDGGPVAADKQGYYLLRAIPGDNSMTLVGLDAMVSAELVERGALQGMVVDPSSLHPQVQLMSDGVDLRFFLSNADLEEVFSGVFANLNRRK